MLSCSIRNQTIKAGTLLTCSTGYMAKENILTLHAQDAGHNSAVLFDKLLFRDLSPSKIISSDIQTINIARLTGSALRTVLP